MDTPESIEKGLQNQASKHSLTACQRCRDQKLKCSREHPICTRCRRLGANCVYPSPPDRRGRKLQRISDAHTTVRSRFEPPLIEHSPANPNRNGLATSQHDYMRDVQGHSSQPNPHSHNTSSAGHTASLDGVPCLPNSQTRDQPTTFGKIASRMSGWDCSPANVIESINDASHSYPTQLRKTGPVRRELIDFDQPHLPPRAVGLSLLEVYFTRVYNAPFLFHKPLLFRNYLDGKLPDILLKAIFALSTLFLSSNAHSQKRQAECPELETLSRYHSCGLPWAKSALKEAMPLAIEEQSLMVVQALECLQHYWFAVGDGDSGNLCLELAYSSCHILGYNKRVTGDLESPDLSLESELRRRCFWACWVSTCIVAVPEPRMRSAWQDAAMIPLPACIHDTEVGYEIILNEQMDNNWCSSYMCPHEPSRSPVAAALLVKMVGVWARVQLLITDSVSLSTPEIINTMKSISELAMLVFEAIHYMDRESAEADIRTENGRLMLFVKALYYLCQITLHSTIVPLFSGTSIDEQISRETVRESAQMVINKAHSFENLLTPFLSAKVDATHLPPLVGYGAFITAMVLLVTEVSRRDKTSPETLAEKRRQSQSLSSVESILGLLNTLRGHWKALEHPYEKLRVALRVNLLSYKMKKIMRNNRPADNISNGAINMPPPSSSTSSLAVPPAIAMNNLRWGRTMDDHKEQEWPPEPPCPFTRAAGELHGLNSCQGVKRWAYMNGNIIPTEFVELDDPICIGCFAMHRKTAFSDKWEGPNRPTPLKYSMVCVLCKWIRSPVVLVKRIRVQIAEQERNCRMWEWYVSETMKAENTARLHFQVDGDSSSSSDCISLEQNQSAPMETNCADRRPNKATHDWVMSQRTAENEAQLAAEDTGDGFNQSDAGCADSTSLTQPCGTQDDAWYSLCFAEAGIEQFAGYEPLSLFQQDWMNFN